MGIFKHKDISEPLNWLYEVAEFRIHNALAGAAIYEKNKIESLDVSVIYVEGSAFNAGVWHSHPAGCVVSILSSVPVLTYMACVKYAQSIDLSTGLPYMDNEVILERPNKIRIETSLPESISNEKDLEKYISQAGKEYPGNNGLGCLLFELAMKYIAMHECMHAILGHTRFLQINHSFASFTEFSSERTAETDGSFFQMLELIADRHTVRGLLVRLLEGDFDEFYTNTVLTQVRCPKELFLLRCLVHAFCLLFHLIPGSQLPLADSDAYHPHPYIRARWMCNELMQENEQLDGDYEVLKCMTAAAANLIVNFDLPANWENAMRNDFDHEAKTSLADDMYRSALSMASKWQTELSKNYGLFYE